jgi:hypothetical protein
VEGKSGVYETCLSPVERKRQEIGALVTLTIHGLGVSQHESRPWFVFNLTVRGFTILGCRWQPETRSIQGPVSFVFDPQGLKYVKKAVVCAYGAHINRLREALLAYRARQEGRASVAEHLLTRS